MSWDRGARAALAVCVASAAAAGHTAPILDPVAVTIGVGAGAVRADLPDPNRPGERFGTEPYVRFDIGWAARPWLELGAELGLGFVGESDSLREIVAQTRPDAAAPFTLVHWGVVVRPRLALGSGRWAGFGRAGLGGVTLSLSAPEGGRGRRDDGVAWNAGGGLELRAHRRLLLRAEALWLGQSDGATHHHAVATLSLLYAFPRAAFDGDR